MDNILLFGLGLVVGSLAGVIGTGASLILLPILVVIHGPKVAVPIMAIASVMANLGRVWAWLRMIDWRLLAQYSLGSVPCAALGARTLVAIPSYVADLVLGAFFLVVIPLRRRLHRNPRRAKPAETLACGAGVGFLTGLVQSTGPLSLAVFSTYGLRAGGLLGTESAASLLIYGTKTLAFGVMGVLGVDLLLQGLFIGSSLLLGAFAGKAIVTRIGEQRFYSLLDLVIGVNAVVMILAAIHEFRQV